MTVNANSSQTLGQRAVSGFIWEGLNRIGRQVLQFGISIILAHLLAPNDFGLVEMTVIFINLAYIVSDLGLSAALTQRIATDEDQLIGVFWLNIGVALLFWGLS